MKEKKDIPAATILTDDRTKAVCLKILVLEWIQRFQPDHVYEPPIFGGNTITKEACESSRNKRRWHLAAQLWLNQRPWPITTLKNLENFKSALPESRSSDFAIALTWSPDRLDEPDKIHHGFLVLSLPLNLHFLFNLIL